MAVEIPGYTIIRRLGKGGMATVYLARQDIFEREVALKVMSRALADDESFGQRFFREAKIVSQLVHPHIVTVHDVGVHKGCYYLSMEHIDGGDLKQTRHEFSLQQKIQAVLDIAKALDYAGSKGFVHRDIKPENIMFHKSDGRAVLTDFGIAKAAKMDHSMTQTGIAIGTPHYMSPEQAKGKTVDPRSDLYSLGVVFFLLLTGRVPFDAESAVAIGIKHITEPVPLLPMGMEALQPVIDTLMAKSVTQRYQTAQQFIADMHRIDVALLEQTVAFAQDSRAKADDREMPTEKSGSAGSAGQISLEFDDREELSGERSSILPWLVGLVLAVGLAGWLYYQQRPDIFDPWLERGTHVVTAWLESLEEGGDNRLVESASDTPNVETEPGPVVPTLAAGAIERDRVVPASTPVPQPTALPVAEYQAKIDTLSDLFSKDPTYLGELVTAHFDLLKRFPRHVATERSLDRLLSAEVAKVEDLIADQRYSSASKKLEQLKSVFASRSSPRFAELQQQIARSAELTRLLKEARAFRDAGQLTRPEGSNATARFQQVLAKDPGNTDAKSGLESIAGTLVTEAQDLFDDGNTRSALAKVNKALTVVTQHRAAMSLKQRIEQKIAYEREIEDFFRMAELRASQGEYFLPKSDNANYYFQRILQREPSNSRALAAQEVMVDNFARAIWRQVEEELFSAVRDQLDSASRALPDNARVKSLKLAVDEVLAEKARR